MTRGVGLVRRRAGGQRVLLAAALAVLLPALVLVTVIRMHAAVAERDGVRHALAAVPGDQRAVSVRYVADEVWQGDATSRAALAQDLRQHLASAFGGVPVATEQAVSSVRYAVDEPGSADVHAAVFFLSADDLAGHAKLVQGAWPRAIPAGAAPAGTGFEAAVPAGAAAAAHWTVGSVITADAKLGGKPSPVTIVGVYQPTDPAARFWQRADPFRGAGRQQQEIPVYGPLLVDPSVTGADAVVAKELDLLAEPDFSQVTVEQAAALAGDLQAFDTAPEVQAAPGGMQVVATENLSDAVTGIDADRAISARLIWLPVIELTLLALTAMVLTTRLLADHRRESDGLLRARGASASRLAGVGLAEGLALALPAAASSPYLARILLRQISGTSGSAVRAGHVPVTADLWVVAGTGALVAAGLLGFAGVRAAGSFVDARRARGRSARRTAIQRSGLDVMVAALGAGALWEVGQFGTGSAHAGRLGWPLVVAPSVLLLAGALLSLRLLPFAVGGVEWVAARRRGAVPALAGWRVGRTARFYAAPMILLIMAVAVGVQAVVFVGSADRSARDQAAQTVGADVRVSGLPPLRPGWDGALAALPGAGPGLVGLRDMLTLGAGQSAVTASALALDPERGKSVVPLRADQASGGWPAAVGALAAGGYDAHGQLPGAALPGRPATLSVDVRYQSSAAPGASALGPMRVQALVVDAYGLGDIVDLGEVDHPDGAVHTLTAKLIAPEGEPAYPLRVSGLRVSYLAPACPVMTAVPPLSDQRCSPRRDLPPGDAEQVSIGAGRLRADGRAVRAPEAAALVLGDAAKPAAQPRRFAGDGVPPSGTALTAGSGASDLVSLTEDSGYGIDAQPANSHVLAWAPAGATSLPAVVPAVAGRGLADALHVGVGDVLPVDALGPGVSVRFVAVVDHLPGLDRDQPALLLPIGSLDLLTARSQAAVGTAEWWGTTAPGGSPGRLAAEAVRVTSASQYLKSATVVDRQDLAAAIGRDPIRSGVKLTLLVAAVAALLFILIGFALHSVLAVQERAMELALLNALGLSRRKTAAMLLAEQALLVLLGVAAGGALAAVTIRSELPLMILTDVGTQPIPKPVAVFDAPLLAEVGAGAVVFLLATVAAVVAGRRPGGVAAALRSGEDR